MTSSSAQPESPQSRIGEQRGIPAAAPVGQTATSAGEQAARTAAPRPGRSLASLGLWAFSLLIAYALSPLPVGVALDLMPPRVSVPAHKSIRTVYAPLIWLSDHSTRVREFYNWYESLLEV